MKKILCLLLAAVMILSMTACGGEPEETKAPKETTEPTVATTAVPETEPATEPTTEPVTEPATEPATEPEQTNPVLGVINGNTYENQYFGFGCELDSSWYVATKEEIAQIMGLTSDVLNDGGFELQLETSGVAYGLYAMKGDGLTSLNMVVENLGLLYSLTMDEKTYAETAAKQLPDAFAAMGMTDVKAEVVTISFAGKDHVAITLEGNMSGVMFYETLVCVKAANYIAVITAGSYQENTTKDILNGFYEVK